MSTQPKRHTSTRKSISPPPKRKKLQSTTTATSVSTFFTPASQKPAPRTTWRTVADSLLIARYEPPREEDEPTPRHELNTTQQGAPKSTPRDKREGSPKKRRKIAAFDLDGTLIRTASSKKFATDASDWTWWDGSVPSALRSLHSDDYQVVVITNQGGLNLQPSSKTAKSDAKRVADFKGKVNAVLEALGLPVSLYAATQKDGYRKPRTGIWKDVLEDYDFDEGEGLDVGASLFVGDAAGREKDEDGMGKKDFACSDRDFAANVGLAFQTPEEFFLKTEVREYKRVFDPGRYLREGVGEGKRYSKRNEQDVVVFCGSPGVGKSSFYWRELQPLGYERINQDQLKSRDKCLQRADELLKAGKSVAVDNTNADTSTREHWLRLASKHSVPARCVYLRGDPKLCEHNDTVRALAGSMMNPESRAMLPTLAFTSYGSRHEPPRSDEGFQDIVTIDFEFQGSEEQRAIWSRYWI